jgi:3-phosphoshikimate 1-carboxyvinyltransferase
MNKIIRAASYKGHMKAPASKSYMQRAVAIALLADGETTIFNPSLCDDTYAALAMAEDLGAEVSISASTVRIKGTQNLKSAQLSAGESGLGVRTFIPIAALHRETVHVCGKGSLLQRPIAMVEAPLKQLGASIESNGGYLPVQIQGPLRGGTATID